MDTKTTIAQAAARAIEIAGGAEPLAARLTEATGQKVRADTVRKWKYNGVAPVYVLWVTQFTGVPVHELRPEMVIRGARAATSEAAA